MADGYDPLSASLILQNSVRALTPLSAPKATPPGAFARAGLGLSTDALAGSFQGSPASLNLPDAQNALAVATASARQILETLDSLYVAVGRAQTSSLVGEEVQLAVGGTRISRLNIQAEARQALREINQLVKNAERNGVNLIASDGRAALVQTSRFGGQVTLEIQPLDSRALGFGAPNLAGLVDGFKGVTDTEIERARRGLALARETVSRRLQTLIQAEERLSYSSAPAQTIRALDIGAAATLLPRGSVVNLIA